MKKLIGLALALLFLAGCAVPGGNTAAAPSTDAVTETWDIYVGSIYSIRYELGDLKDNFTLTPTKARDGNSVKIRTQVLTDADIHLYLDDGSEIGKTHSDGDYWEYAFTMPKRDLVITAKPYTEAELQGLDRADMDFIRGVQYVRTDMFDYEETQPMYFWISSAEELRDYIEEVYVCLAKAQGWYGDAMFAENDVGLAPAKGRYDEAFFAENDLLVVIRYEGSGSTRHELTGVKVTPSRAEGKRYVLQPEFKRLVGMTCDEAGWHILIAIAKDHGAAVSELAEPVFTTVKFAV